MTEEDLFDYFSHFGPITEVEIIRKDGTGLSKGYGFIRCLNREITSRILNFEHNLQGRKIDVNRASEKWETQKMKKEIYQRKLFINGISQNLKDFDLEKYFSRFGEVKKAYIIGKSSGKKRGERIGFVEFVSKRDAKTTLDIHWHEIVKGSGVYVSVAMYNPKGQNNFKEKNNEFMVQNDVHNFSQYQESRYGGQEDFIENRYQREHKGNYNFSDKEDLYLEKFEEDGEFQRYDPRRDENRHYYSKPKEYRFEDNTSQMRNRFHKKNKEEFTESFRNEFYDKNYKISKINLKNIYWRNQMKIIDMPRSYSEGRYRLNLAIKFMTLRSDHQKFISEYLKK